MLMLTLAASSAGCKVGLDEASVEPTGCELEDIEISNVHVPIMGAGAPSQWTATCGDQKHFCIDMRGRVVCTTDPRQE
jgi:hypothetical protein